MSKFFVLYQKGFWIFKEQVGMELIEAESWEEAYEKLSPRVELQMMRQVNDDCKPQDFKPLIQWEAKWHHQEKMVKYKSNIKICDNKK
jgi:hypothetical protein